MASPSSSPASILILGGSGPIGRRLVRKLASSFYTSASFPEPSDNLPTILIACRDHSSHSHEDQNNNNNNNVHHVHFDWDDPTTWENPFAYNPRPLSTSSATSYTPPLTPPDQQPRWPPVRAVYLSAPASLRAAEGAMTHFVALARERGARRFVLQSAFSSSLPLAEVAGAGAGTGTGRRGSGGGPLGKVQAYLREMGGRGEVEWAVVEGGWVQENFSTFPAHVNAIRNESKIYSATGEGRIPWVSADDVAAVAARALTDPDPPNTEYQVLGPELLSYGDIAQILTQVLGRRVVHVPLHASELERRHRAYGMPEDYARLLGAMETAVKFGAEERTNDAVLAMTGTAPRRFRDFAAAMRDVWEGRVEPEEEGWF
ncbi:hypothetical protein VTJ04DRAFT_3579 [Mycothermus thermophilus]|uniref:uncharacterized protein n=1 Tax=Humicola insolens TaxID=85995 RepID=UPI003741FF61